MLSTLMYALFACFSPTLLAKPLQAVNDQTLQSDIGDLRLPSQLPNVLSNSNASLSLVNGSLSKEIDTKCDGKQYGFKPDVEDCASALRYQLVGRDRIKFGPRGSTSSEGFVSLPYRLMGGM